MDQSAAVLDIDFGMSQLSGNKTLLLTLLNKFSDEYRSLNDDLQAFVQQGEFDQAYSLVHTLKGVTGNLGLFALHHASKPVENSIRNEHKLPDDYSRFVEIMDETLASIESLASQPVDEPPTQGTDALAIQAKAQMMTALKASEFIAQDRLDDWLDNLGLAPQTRQSLEDAVDELDYEHAIELLENV